jgi:hypothetical protein
MCDHAKLNRGVKTLIVVFALSTAFSSDAQVRVGSAKSDDDSITLKPSKNNKQSQQDARQAEFDRKAAAIKQGSDNANAIIQQSADNARKILQDKFDRDMERTRQRQEEQRVEREQARQERQQQQSDNNSSSSGYTVETWRPQPTVQPTRDNPYGIQDQNYYSSQPTPTTAPQQNNYYHSQPTPAAAPESNPVYGSLSKSFDEQLDDLYKKGMQAHDTYVVTHQDDSIDSVPSLMDTVEQWGIHAANHVVSVVNFTGGQIQDAVKPATDFINQGAQKLQGAQKDLDDIININTDAVTGD